MAAPSSNRRIGGIFAVAFGVLFLLFLVQIFRPMNLPFGSAAAEAQTVAPLTRYATLDLKSGPVEIEFLPSIAPKAVAQMEKLISEKFYDGLKFHRVIAGFMAQTGDPTGTGAGGSDLPDLPAEFSDVPFKRGTIGMARTSDPNSANSQFFIMFAPAPHLNGQYTVVGQVVSGMDNVDKIKKGDPADNGLVTDPDIIVSFRLDPGYKPVAGGSSEQKDN